MNRPNMPRWIARTAVGGACVLFALSVVSVVSNSSAQQPPTSVQRQHVATVATPGPGSQRSEVDAVQSRDSLEVQEAQLEARRALVKIDELRAEQAKRWKTYYEKMVREGRVIEDRMLAARDDVIMIDAHVAAERAELKVAEIRLKLAQRRAGQGGQPPNAAEQAKEELDELDALLQEKQDLLKAGEARAEQARRKEAHHEKLFRSGLATEDLVLAARDDVLHMDSVIAWARLELKVIEMRVKKARRLASKGATPADDPGHRIAELEERLAVAEMKSDVLQHEVGRLRRELPRESHGAR
jgi:hypothetical protein